MSKQLKLPTLLVIADNPTIRFWVKKQLDDQFFVIGAERKQEAISALNARLDFIIIDSEFEDCDALELCEILSQQTKKNMVPVLLVTGRLKKSFRDRAMRSGVTHFISDQLDREELEMRIKEGLEAASIRQKTEDVGLSIKIPKLVSNGSLKKKVFLNEPSMQLLSEGAKEGNPTAFLFIRIDHFETIGKKKELLHEFSEFVNSFLREKDLLTPSSEGNFVLLLHNTNVPSAQKVAKKLQEQIQKHLFQSTPRLTVSIAVSAEGATPKGIHQTIQSAIQSLKTHSETNLIISLDPESP